MLSSPSATPPLDHSTTSPAPRGFTLLELVAVMLILCIVMAVTVPSLRNFGRGRETSEAATQLVALCGWARAQAISRGVSYRLNLDPAARTYWLTVQPSAGTAFEPVGAEFGRVFTVPEGVSISWDAPRQQDGQYVEFFPSGRSDPATIQLVAPSGIVTEVACPSATETYQIVAAAPDGRQGIR